MKASSTLRPLELLLDNREYARVWGAQVVSLAGDWFTVIALSVIVTTARPGNSLAVSGLMMCVLLPVALVSPWSGVLADRFDRRTLLILADLVRLSVLLVLIPVSQSGVLWPVYALTFLHYSVSTLFEPARAALLAHLVREGDLERATTLDAITWSTMVALGSALGGSVVALVGVRNAFLVDALTFAASAALIFSIASRGRPQGASHAGPGLLEGLRWLFHRPSTAATLLVKPMAGLMAVDLMIVLLATRLFVLGAGGAGSIGLLYFSFGVGAAVGPLILGRFNDGSVPRMRRLVSVGGAFVWIGLVALSVAPTLAIAVPSLFLRGIGGSSNWTFSNVILQKTVPDAVKGRVFALDLALMHLVAASASLFWGTVADALGVRALLVWMAVLSVLPYAAWTVSTPWLDERAGRDAQCGTVPGT